ncbi:NUDIX hydrolase [Paenisporosarcina cavernae]|uniref:NUDIX domain-containing protein n=1 Tax=Paenisporosarcina cavernae TaxID=2320858 RepID=A0A385YRY4_9BACL|nr:NUDIX domain-containing protein [Paenisporosarcina cavernae]AYC28482.1 NUDIX domain-containing protein [Paenisporosarcina cavernae]
MTELFHLGAHAIIQNEDGKVLLLKRTYGNKGWSLPGGGVDSGESMYDALLRECIEELSVVVENIVMTGIYYHPSIRTHAAIFTCTLTENAAIQLSAEHSEYKWATLDELSKSQRIRVQDATSFSGKVYSRVFK